MKPPRTEKATRVAFFLFFFFPIPFRSIRSLGFCLNAALGALSFLCCRSCCRHTLPHLRLRNSGSVLRPRASPSHAGSQEGLSRFPVPPLWGDRVVSPHCSDDPLCIVQHTSSLCPCCQVSAWTSCCWNGVMLGSYTTLPLPSQRKEMPGPNSTCTYT